MRKSCNIKICEFETNLHGIPVDFKCERFFLEMLTVLNVETKSSSIVKNNKSVVSTNF